MHDEANGDRRVDVAGGRVEDVGRFWHLRHTTTHLSYEKWLSLILSLEMNIKKSINHGMNPVP